ncbi:hypothetical protein T08_7151 [Trichinella sp. T8]|nr:hypothetical protein T08_7151 [Trichinella sp. T8]
MLRSPGATRRISNIVKEEWTAWTTCGKNTNTRLSLCDASNATSMFDRTVISSSVKRYKGKSVSSAEKHDIEGTMKQKDALGHHFSPSS